MRHQIEFLIALLLAIALVAAFSRRVGVTESILLFLGGVALGVIPGAPRIAVPPDVIFLVFLPPLVYYAAFVSSPRELRTHARSISMLAVGLVFATTAGVAVVAHLVIPQMPWAAAFALGAILAPTDPVAATTVIRNLGAPQALVTLLEGEALINDAVGLTLYRVAVAAAVAGTFSVLESVGRFALVAVGGLAIGLAVGWVVARVRPKFDDPQVEITISLFTPYLSYLPAEAAGTSGILATVVTGLYVGWKSPGLFRPGTRLAARSFWSLFTFLLNSFLFLLLGLQFRTIVDGIEGASPSRLLGYAAAVCGTAIGIRLVWQFTVPYLMRVLSRRLRREQPPLPWQQRLVIGWSGMRGAVSLAAALAIPLRTDSRAAFPRRDLIIFLTFAGIFATLVLQGLTLPLLMRALGVRGDERTSEAEDRARANAAHAALARLEDVAQERRLPEETLEGLRDLYEDRLMRLKARLDADGDGHPELEQRADLYRELLREMIDAERDTIVEMRDKGEIDNEVMRRIERDLDLTSSRLLE
ncbi:MAG: Na+/H+ antiporter [Thermoleophilaceae bacterium]